MPTAVALTTSSCGLPAPSWQAADSVGRSAVHPKLSGARPAGTVTCVAVWRVKAACLGFSPESS